MTTGIWILGDQLYHQQSALQQNRATMEDCQLVMIESLEHIRKRKYHRQKIVLVWSAMRHFAKELVHAGWECDYFREVEGFERTLEQWVEENHIDEVHIMKPNDRPFESMIQGLQLPCKIVLEENNAFIWREEEFRLWADNRKSLILEHFYRESRRRLGLLMDDEEPEGGEWNYDKYNRERAKQGLSPSPPVRFEPDSITQEVIDVVANLDVPLFGELDSFGWGVTRSDAQVALDDFIDNRLATFGPYEDVMLSGEPSMWHSTLSPYLNLGLLRPLAVAQEAEKAYYDRNLEIRSVEGFIRQIIGWREFIRGVYAVVEREYPESNFFNHDRPLPGFYWSGETGMKCMRSVLKQLQDSGYAHHIQRLMILSNFALIAGLLPQAVEDWFHAVFIDSYDWVMQPNVIGMGLFADGGVLSTKPYSASANYINKMSDYCKACDYDHRSRTGANACPFNVLYWNFLITHEDKLRDLGRMGLVLSHLDKMDDEEIGVIQEIAAGLMAGFT
ncbi:cryptochrome/photolyase family protein [Candidatus Thorarchaeota archaeon]|nr:MAG: cryptochrome/photolyase family protein [Candidatus Thorarchaeota archaeon]